MRVGGTLLKIRTPANAVLVREEEKIMNVETELVFIVSAAERTRALLCDHIVAERLRVVTCEGQVPLHPGSHLVTARAGYTHHGIYVGNGMVVQYSGLTSGARGGSVEEIPLQRFARGRPFWISSGRRPSFDAPEIVRRARSRVGEHRYDLLTNNCEHFCEWCLHGQQRSYQVERLLGRNRYVQQIASRAQVSKMAETLLMLLNRASARSVAGFADEEELECPQSLRNYAS
jgi:NC domain.